MANEVIQSSLSAKPNFIDNVRYGSEALIVAAETTPFPPINEMVRFGAMAWAIKYGYEPTAVAAVTGAATILIEAPAALASADLLASPRAQNATVKFNDILEKFKIPRDVKLNGFSKAAVAYLGGSAVVTWLRHREAPERTRKDNIRYGLSSAAALSVASATQGYAVAKGFEAPDPITISAGLAAVGGGFAGTKYFSRKLQRKSINQDGK